MNALEAKQPIISALGRTMACNRRVQSLVIVLFNGA